MQKATKSINKKKCKIVHVKFILVIKIAHIETVT